MKHAFHNTSRRAFLQRAAALSSLGTAAPFALNLAALGNASAQSAGDYKAVVCLFMMGGNDAFNMVLPTDTASWNHYVAARSPAPQLTQSSMKAALPFWRGRDDAATRTA